jgi:hypothetical protein
VTSSYKVGDEETPSPLQQIDVKSLIYALKKCILMNRDEKTYLNLNNASPNILLKSKKKITLFVLSLK